MKKSNKILLGGFLIGLLLISTIHITLYAKYRSGHYSLYNEQETTASTMQLFPNILVVCIQDLPEGTIRFADVAAVERDDEEYVQYMRKGDTLIITGNGRADVNSNWNKVNINVPAKLTLFSSNSSLVYRPAKLSSMPEGDFQLKNSNITFAAMDAPFRIGNMRVSASDGSAITFRRNMQVDRLDVNLKHSSIDYDDGDVGKLSVQTDSSSRISLKAKHLSRAIITPVFSQ